MTEKVVILHILEKKYSDSSIEEVLYDRKIKFPKLSIHIQFQSAYLSPLDLGFTPWALISLGVSDDSIERKWICCVPFSYFFPYFYTFMELLGRKPLLSLSAFHWKRGDWFSDDLICKCPRQTWIGSAISALLQGNSGLDRRGIPSSHTYIHFSRLGVFFDIL